ncbi:MAG: DUF370 domain-containing protein [Clostridiales bacterium]|jgi:hypothetical protein|nr:DUF370 domain-containing protein [Clostridiales bacterium]
MYLHICGDSVVPLRDIVMVLNNEIDTAQDTIDVIKGLVRKNDIEHDINFIDESVKSIVFTNDSYFVSPISTSTLKKRLYEAISYTQRAEGDDDNAGKL